MSDNDVKGIFSKNFLSLRKQRDLTQQQVADAIEVSKTTISEWESAKKLPNAGSIEKISAFFDVPKSALFAEGNDRFISYEKMLRLPIVGKISCGNGHLAMEEIESYEPTPAAWLNGGEYFYLRAEGDSMINSRIFNGDLVLIRKQDNVENGQIGVVLIDDQSYLKKVYRYGDTIKLESSNPSYPVIECDTRKQDCRVVGILKKIIVNI